jgi:hypothetical protein
MGIISTIALAIPIVLLLVFKLAWYNSFPGLFIFYTISLIANIITLGYISSGSSVNDYYSIAKNFLDIPLLLLFLTYFSGTAPFRKKLVLTSYIFIGYELLVLIVFGFTIKASVIALGPGLLVITFLALSFFVQEVKTTMVNSHAIGKAFMAAGLLFAFAGFTFVYTVYYLLDTPYKNDTKLVYFMITIFSTVAITVGLFFERKRVQYLEELKTTQKELKALYGEEEIKKTTAPLETIVFHFDKKEWN